ncbi:MAG: UPF0182 family protein [Actinomycetales bacterium]|nr:UPF0182 family protein [Actinomycetales bacterium]
MAVLGAILILGSIFTTIWTEKLWYDSVEFTPVFTKVLLTRTLMFLAFAVIAALVVGLNMYLAHKFRPNEFGLVRNDPPARYRYVLTPILGKAFLGAAAFVGVFAGIVATSRWSVFLEWRNSTSFGYKDPQFGKDASFYVFDLPWFQFLTSFTFGLLIVSIMASVFVHYVFGGITLRNKGIKFTRQAQIQVAVLAGLLMLMQAVRFWLDRFAMMTGTTGLFNGVTYTDANSRIPSRNILIGVAIVCALLFFATIITRSWVLPGIGVAMLVLSSVLIGTLWPTIMQRFQVDPSEPDREEPFLKHNIEGTRYGFGIDKVEVKPYEAVTELTPKELNASASSHVSSRLLDPTLVSPAFEQLQQVRGYYTVQETLDVDRYRVGDSETPQDVVIAAREVNLEGLQASQRTWTNDHTVYTHGYGVVAAYGNKRGNQGEPVWIAKDIPPTGEFEFTTPPRIYFGEKSPAYSIVGRPSGAKPIEVDIPRGSETGGKGDDVSSNTYAGKGGVPMGSLFTQALFAIKYAEPKIVLSDRVNENSKILFDRVPRDRVKKVAPWLTLDGDTYPAVVDGRVVWIVDGYTTSKNFPYSQARSLGTATDDSLTQTAAQVALPTDQVNYMRNSVKAVVDAYDGTVVLYEWDEQDPILKTWKKVFPGLVKDKSEIDEALLEHMRYPTDFFKVQRDVLTRYHVTDAQTFYEDGERWKVPEDPSNKTKSGEFAQPPYYLSMTRPGEADPKFSLTSVFLPNNRQNLAAFMSVDAEASDPENYGSIQILQLPSDTQVGGPNQIAAKFQADAGVTEALLRYEQSEQAKILRGNLLTLPVGQGLLYVQPVYIQRSVSEGSYPVLQLIIASFGDEVGIGQSLDEALRVALGLETANLVDLDESDPPTTTPSPSEPGASKTVEQHLTDADRAYTKAQAALKDGDLAEYQRQIDIMAKALENARKNLK